MAVQAVIMVTPVLIGNGQFWTTVNKKRWSRLSPITAQVITLAPWMLLRVAFGCLVWPIACRVQKRTQHKMEHFDKHY